MLGHKEKPPQELLKHEVITPLWFSLSPIYLSAIFSIGY